MDLWIQSFRQRREEYQLTQREVAEYVGISKRQLIRIENGQSNLKLKLKEKLEDALVKLNPNGQLTVLIDYVRIRFKTINAEYVVENILKIKKEHFGHEPFAFYKYAEQYIIGDIFVFCSMDEEKGVLLELKGKGCRQFELYLKAQHRTWYDFFRQVHAEGAVIKRLDLAVNDEIGILDIPKLAEKCSNGECISLFRTFKNYQSGELVRNEEQHKSEMGNTLYIGSLKSEVYFCIYEKDYEQYIKNGTPLEDAIIKNRFEIRLKSERATQAVYDLICYEDIDGIIFSIINYYMRIVDEDKTRNRYRWKMNRDWKMFVGEGRRKIKLTIAPEPFDIDNTYNWIAKQVAPTIKALKELDEINDTDIIEQLFKEAKLSKKYENLLKNQQIPIEEKIWNR